MPIVAAAVTVVLWASAFVAIRQAGHQISAGALAFGRLAVGSIVLGALVATRQRVWPSGRQWLLVLACGVSWFGIYNIALNEAERHVGAGIAAMLVNVGPIIIALLAGLFLGEGFPRGLLGGGLLAFCGVVLIGIATAGGAIGDATGVVLCVVAAVGYAVGVVCQKPVLGHVPALSVTWLGCVVGMLVSAPFLSSFVHDVSHASAQSLLLMLYLGVFPTALAFTTWAYALRHTTAGRMGATTYIVPPLAILMGWLLLAERPPWLALVGGAVALIGVAVTRRVR
ncbi:MAG: DMT family transporter [Candidatus Dormibacteraeota bacterium]|nr:DMT family transporter [Candidatus Dormibacteraeota bacterium]MBV9526406.1 DMT family transporter [Candidatus Dormibacteraeota bacterium]